MSDTVQAIAADVRAGRRSAIGIAQAALVRIRERNGQLNAVTRLLEDRALAEAGRVDAAVAQGRDPGPLAGVPYAVKDLFDVAGLPTTAGAGMLRNAAPAGHDAEAIRRLQAAGAVLVATCNMDEFAYGFATVNQAFGTTRNPHDPARLAGGSSGGSAAAVAAGMVPFALGSDTNGSIRVPAALTGLWGLKPAHGTLPMGGVYPFVDSFDDIGPFTASLADLQLVWQVLGGRFSPAPARPRVAHLGGWFEKNVATELAEAIEALDLPRVDLPQVDRARSAAFLMTAAEGGQRHLPALRTRALEFDPATRDRLIAGAMLPAAHYLTAQEFRATFRAAAEALFQQHDVLVTPAAGEVAPLVDNPFIMIDGQPAPARAQLGLYTQPLSFIGLPVIAAPLKRPGMLPLGVQLVGWPGREGALLTLAQEWEADGLLGSSLPA